MSNTGDFQLPASIADNTSVNIKLVGVLLSVAFAVGGAYWKIGSMEKRGDETVERVKALESADVEWRLRLQRMEDSLIALKSAVDDGNRKLDRLDRLLPPRLPR